MKIFADSLRRSLDNGAYAALCPDTSIIDNYHRRKLLTDTERDELVARWNELNPPAPEPDPEPEPTEPAGEQPSG